jgi:hypothetical protein
LLLPPFALRPVALPLLAFVFFLAAVAGASGDDPSSAPPRSVLSRARNMARRDPGVVSARESASKRSASTVLLLDRIN